MSSTATLKRMASGTKNSAPGKLAMAQWDVYENPVASARERLPFLLVLQSDLLKELPTRLVVPLSLGKTRDKNLPKQLVPRFDVKGVSVVLKPHEAGVVAASALRKPIASLRDDARRVVAAIDAVISGV
jgi:toxin CcdB